RAYCTLNMTNIIEGTSMKQIKKSSVATALGAVVIGSLASTVAVADVNPFGMQALESGYSQFAAEGKCGEGKCGGDKKADKEGKCGEGKCGGDKKAGKEGKCGEGKCGSM
ncbi:MAG: hypothetical protein MK088_20010, partial [Alteromonas sp.]|nr:hypothetical protein [Alteromonas sp.]